eukprot:1251828-Rhodomonas_salina.2
MPFGSASSQYGQWQGAEGKRKGEKQLKTCRVRDGGCLEPRKPVSEPAKERQGVWGKRGMKRAAMGARRSWAAPRARQVVSSSDARRLATRAEDEGAL